MLQKGNVNYVNVKAFVLKVIISYEKFGKFMGCEQRLAQGEITGLDVQIITKAHPHGPR